MDDALLSFLTSLADAVAPVLEQLEPLAPAPMQLLDRPLHTCGWNSADIDAPAFFERRTLDGKATAERNRRTKATRRDPKADLRRNRHREREKRNLMYLRASSQLLEQRLEELKQRQATMTDAQRRDLFLKQSRAELWRALARRRRHERVQSEMENARLRELWRFQQRFVEQIQQLSPVQRGPGPANSLEARVTVSNFDADVLDMLTQDLDILYAQSGRIFADMGLMDAPEMSFESIRRGDSGNVDLLDVAVLQSDYSRMREMAWTRIVSRFLARGGVQVDTSPHQSGRTLAMKIRYHAAAVVASTSLDDSQAAEDMYFEIVLVLRQYVVSPSREVIVWKSLNTGDGRLAGLVAHEMGYCAMHRSIENHEATTLKRVRRLEHLATSAGEEAHKAELFGSLSLAVMEDDVRGALRVFTVEGGPIAQESAP